MEENEGISRPSPLQAERDWKFYAVSCSFMRKYLSILFIFILILHSECGQYFLFTKLWSCSEYFKNYKNIYVLKGYIVNYHCSKLWIVLIMNSTCTNLLSLIINPHRNTLVCDMSLCRNNFEKFCLFIFVTKGACDIRDSHGDVFNQHLVARWYDCLISLQIITMGFDEILMYFHIGMRVYISTIF